MPAKGLMPPSVVMREVGSATPLPSAVGIPMVLPGTQEPGLVVKGHR